MPDRILNPRVGDRFRYSGDADEFHAVYRFVRRTNGDSIYSQYWFTVEGRSLIPIGYEPGQEIDWFPLLAEERENWEHLGARERLKANKDAKPWWEESCQG